MLLPRGWALINHGLPNCVISQCEKTTPRKKSGNKAAERQRANRVAAKTQDGEQGGEMEA